jgi:hypothetical protein
MNRIHSGAARAWSVQATCEDGAPMNVSSASSAMAAQVAPAANSGAQAAPEAKAPAPATDTVSLSPQAKAHLAAQKSCGC